MKKKKVILICSECYARNYKVNKSNINELIVVKKFCKHCNKHTVHKETR